MPLRRAIVPIFLICLMSAGLTSCLARRRAFSRKGSSPTQKLLIADQPSLVDAIVRHYNAIHDFSATVDMVPALGSAEKNQITEYKDVRAYIYFRKPASIRLVGLYPVIRSRAFDMVSDGTQFKLHIPSRNLFIVGRNEIEKPSANKLENLRPQHFLDALLVRPVRSEKRPRLPGEFHRRGQRVLYSPRGARTEWPVASQSNHLVQPPRSGNGAPDHFRSPGNILTDARYSQWRAYDNVAFPKHIEINRPRDEYGVVIDIVKMDINKGVSDDKFVLPQPEGTTLKMVGQASPTAPEPVQGKKK